MTSGGGPTPPASSRNGSNGCPASRSSETGKTCVLPSSSLTKRSSRRRPPTRNAMRPPCVLPSADGPETVPSAPTWKGAGSGRPASRVRSAADQGRSVVLCRLSCHAVYSARWQSRHASDPTKRPDAEATATGTGRPSFDGSGPEHPVAIATASTAAAPAITLRERNLDFEEDPCMGHELYAQPLGDAAVRGPATGFSGPVFDHGNNPAKLRILNGRRLAVRVFPAPGSTDDRLGRGL